MKIAILGWGSLLWDEKPDFDRQIEGWQPDGPVLKLEFSRISSSRAGALTLVIDNDHGSQCTVSYAKSKRRCLDDAICDLRCREGTVVRHIGYVTSDGQSGEAEVPASITEWLDKTEFDSVVWTGLPNNFKDEAPDCKDFSVPEALSYLSTLPPEGKAKAAEYIWRAPEFVRTQLRAGVEAEPWFTKNRA